MVEPLALVAVAFQVALVATLAVAARRRNVSAVVNTAIALLVAMAPSLLALTFPGAPATGPAVTLWLAAAGFLHSLGMLGLYESTLWWDHVTHTVSAAFVAALAYAGIAVAAEQAFGLLLSPVGVAAATVLFTLFVGVFWELAELVAREVADRFDVEPVLVHYGWRDTGLDLMFDVVGALVVVALDVRLFVPLADRFPTITGLLVLGSSGTLLVGSVVMALGVRSSAGARTGPGRR